MRELYATTMQLVHVGGGNPFDVARQRALGWAWRLDGESPDLSERPTGQVSDGDGDLGTTVAWTSMTARSSRAVEMNLHHPDENDETLRWNAAITISEIHGATRASIKLGLDATVYSLRPWRMSLRAPLVVPELMQTPLLAYAGSLELTGTAKLIDGADVSALVADQLMAEDRALPILIAESEVHGPFVDSLARAVAGLAQVRRCRDGNVDHKLREALAGSGYTVPNKGLRLYWPGFGSDAHQLRHPYWTAAQLRRGKRPGGRSVIDQLVTLLAPISTGRVPVDNGVLKVRQEWLQERLEAQREREEAKQARARRQREDAQRAKREAREVVSDEGERHVEEISELRAQLALIDGERKEAEGRARVSEEKELQAVEEAVEHSDRAEALDAENASLRKNISDIGRFDALSQEDQDQGDSLPDELESWQEVEEHLDDLEGPGFCLTAQARGCANGKGRYPRPDLLWKHLKALERAGRAFNEMGADLGMRFEQFAFEQADITVALQDDTYPDCWFEYEGTWHERVPHVKIDDAKPPNEVGRIYFALDSDGKRVIVDWFGTKPDRPDTRRSA